jgi:hypothetical protein
MHAADALLRRIWHGAVRRHADHGGHHVDEGVDERMVFDHVRRHLFRLLSLDTLPTVYVITLILQRTTALRGLVKENTYYMIGSLFFAFTVFWAYVNFSQYFIIWNANMPEETFWYVLREKGTWNTWANTSSSLAISSFRS